MVTLARQFARLTATLSALNTAPAELRLQIPLRPPLPAGSDAVCSASRLRVMVRSSLGAVLLAVGLSACTGGGSGGDNGGDNGGETGDRAGAVAGLAGGNSVLSLGNSQDPDPVVVDHPIAYLRRGTTSGDEGDRVPRNLRDPLSFAPGVTLHVKERASPSAPEVDLTPRLLAAMADAEGVVPDAVDIRGLESSYDGDALVFAGRATPTDARPEPTWNLWLYERGVDALRRVIDSETTANAGNDLDPAFLPDGRLVFVSDRHRRTKAILLDEGKPQFSPLDDRRDRPSLVLHTVETDGSAIKQISFNRSDDAQPTVLDDGRVAYLRWDNARGRDRFSLYAMTPDGRDRQRLYGYDSQDTGTDGASIDFLAPRRLGDGRLLVVLTPTGDNGLIGGDLVAIDVASFVENEVPVAESAGLVTQAQASLLAADIRSDGEISSAGTYYSAYPLGDGTDRLLVTWSQCRVVLGDPAALVDETAMSEPVPVRCPDPDATAADDEGPQAAAPLFGLWVLDTVEQTQQPVVVPREGEAVVEAVVLAPVSSPPVLLDPVPGLDIDQDLVAAGAGVLLIESIFDIDGSDATEEGIDALRNPSLLTPTTRPERFLRLLKPVALPDDDVFDVPNTSFGRSTAEGMKELLGYTNIEPDGSVAVQVPADVPFTVSIVDQRGQRLSTRHQHWLQVRPGEVLVCRGCHDPDEPGDHGRWEGAAPSANTGAPADGPFPGATPDIVAEFGQTMAQARANGAAVGTPAFDLLFTDVWTDPAAAPAEPVALRYRDLDTPAPVSAGCLDNWQSLCRSVISYPAHIAPLWDVRRPVLADDGVTVLADRTCTSCHSAVDDAAMAQVPAAQLDLAASPSLDETDHLVSYRELLFGDVEVEVVEGVLLDRLVQALGDAGELLFEVDEDGELNLDADGQPVPVLMTVPVGPVGRVNGARASADLFAPFAPGGVHAGWLTDAEQRLLSEWLDLGAQYYNDPFAVADE